jgi:hypothetical protein
MGSVTGNCESASEGNETSRRNLVKIGVLFCVREFSWKLGAFSWNSMKFSWKKIKLSWKNEIPAKMRFIPNNHIFLL